MTKLKNTKKGMAKKALSISLVAAMLATSNVPVWAAEFTDGTDAVVEAPVVEEAVDTFSAEAEAPVVEEEVAAPVSKSTVTNDNFNVNLTFTGVENNAVTWGDAVTAKVTVKAKDNATIPSNIKFHYAWRTNGTAASAKDFTTGSEQTLTSEVLTAEMADSTLDLYIYATDSNNGNKTVWSYTSDSIAVKAINVAEYYDSVKVNGTYTYTGEAQNISLNSIELKKDAQTATADQSAAKFQVVQNGDHTNATKKATITLVPTAKGYTGELSADYAIAPMELDGSTNKIADHMEASLTTTSFAYTGDVIRVKKEDVKLIDKKTKEDLSNYLYADEDGYVSIDANGQTNNLATNVGDVKAARLNLIIGEPTTGEHKNYTVTAESTGKHRTIQTENELQVTARALSDVNVSISAQTYNSGKKVEITSNEITFTDKDGKVLTLFDDVEISVPDNAKDVGTYTATITAKEAKPQNVTGSISADFRIVKSDISGGTFANVTNGKLKTAKEYTGEQIVITKEDLGTLKIGDKEVSPTSYELVNGENVNVKNGGYVIVKGLGDYEGSQQKVIFDINPAKVTEIKVTNDKVEKLDTTDPADYKASMGIVVTAKNEEAPAKQFTLVDGTDYKVKFKTPFVNEVGQTVGADVELISENFVLNGKDTEVESTITAKNLAAENIKLKESNFTYTGKVVEPEFDVVIDGKIINPSLYEYEYTNNLKAGTATLTVWGKGENYSDKKVSVNFTIKPADINSLEGVIASKQYTGYSLTLEEKDFNLTLNKEKINVYDNFTLTYGTNVEIGEGTVTLTPKNGNFTGSKTFTFQITGEMLNAGGSFKFYDENGIEVTNPSFNYDGTAKQFAKTVFTYNDSKKELVEGTDYEIKYVDNVYGKNINSNQSVVVMAVAKGKYGSNRDNGDGNLVKGVYTDAEGNKYTNVISIRYIDLEQEDVYRANVSVSNGTYAAGLPVKPNVDIVVKGVVLKEGQDYELNLKGNADLANVTTSNSLTVTVELKNGYEKHAGEDLTFNWGIDKFNLANADVSVDGDKVVVKCGRVDVEASEYTVDRNGNTVTVTAAKDSKNYTGSKTIDVKTESEKPAAPMITDVTVKGNNATVILSGDSEGATGYDYVISKDRDCINNKNYAKVNKNILTTKTTFTYTGQGTYYAYCHAWKKVDGKKVFSDWSNAYPFVVTSITPEQPAITSVKVSKNTVKVTYTKSANATGYDIVLGKSMKKVNGEMRPVEYGKLVKKVYNGNTVTATFTKVPKGTYYVGLHAYNRTSEDGKKVFSPWSNAKKVVVK